MNINKEINYFDDDNASWYVAHAIPHKEEAAVQALKKIARDMECEGDIKDYFIPIITLEKKDEDTKASVTKSCLIGYFAIKLNLTSAILKLINKIQRSSKHRITFFLNKKMNEKDLQKMRDSVSLSHENEILYQIGDNVIITHEPFLDMVGCVTKIDAKLGKISVTLDILGRTVPVEFELSKVKKKRD